jgi:hypothetical protein
VIFPRFNRIDYDTQSIKQLALHTQAYGLTMANFLSIGPDACMNLCREPESVLLVHAYISKLTNFTKQVRVAHDPSVQANTALAINARVIIMAFVAATHPTEIFTPANPNADQLQIAATNLISKVDEITNALTSQSEDISVEEFITYDFANTFSELLNTYALLFSEFIDRDRVQFQADIGNIVQGLVHIATDAEIAAIEE